MFFSFVGLWVCFHPAEYTEGRVASMIDPLSAESLNELR